MAIKMFKDFIGDEAGATAVEYSVFIALFSLSLMAAWATTGDGISLQFLTASDTLDAAPDVGQTHTPGGD
jgi:Flp pilus assembly pilin Flp